jgi:hypothetical protein
MKLLGWMTASSILTAIVLSLLVDKQIRLEIWAGMAGPLIAAAISWIAMERQYARNHQGMTRLMVQAFAAKMVFFAIYIIVLLRSRCVRPIPFVICFACYYLALHIVEAMGLSRMQTALSSADADMRRKADQEMGEKL